jgi:hypothetical protein
LRVPVALLIELRADRPRWVIDRGGRGADRQLASPEMAPFMGRVHRDLLRQHGRLLTSSSGPQAGNALAEVGDHE